MSRIRRGTVIAVSIGLLIYAVRPGFTFLQLVLLSPSLVSIVLAAVTVSVVTLALRADQASSKPDLLSRQRHALRRLTFTTPSAWSAVLIRQNWEEGSSASHRIPVYRLAGPSISGKVNTLFDSIKAHFISPWYERISPSPAFPNAVETLLRQSTSELSKRIESVDWATFTVSRLVPLVTDHLHHFRSIEHLAASTAPNHPVLPLPLPKRAHPTLASGASHIHADAISPTIEAHLRGHVANMLDRILPEHDKADVVRTIIQEVLLGSVLGPIFEMLCDSDFWNRQIDDRGGRYLHEQKQVNRFLSALSNLQQPVTTPLPSGKSTLYGNAPPTASITAQSSTKQFETFIRSISKLRTLGDARRLRADVERERRMARIAQGQEADKNDESEVGKKRLKTARQYVHRLERAKLSIDARIAALSGTTKPSSVISPESSLVLPDREDPTVTLYSILSDPSSLAYWLEHMERRGRSRLVQFWLTVEGFKDPLEAASQDAALDAATLPVQDEFRVLESRTIVEDVSFLYLAYFSSTDDALVGVQLRHSASIRQFAESPPVALSAKDAHQMKYAIFASQKEVYLQMVEDDWEDFKRGELYRKALVNLRKPTSAEKRTIPDPRPQLLPAPMVSHQTAPQKAAPMLSTPLHPAVNSGYFSPRAAQPVTSVLTTPPSSHRADSSGEPPSLRFSRAGSEQTASLRQAMTNVVTPPPINRNISQLDELMSPLDGMTQNPLFGDDNDELATEAEREEVIMQAERMEAIQAALNEIIASDDLPESERDSGTTSHARPAAVQPLHDSTRRLASRSADNLKAIWQDARVASAPQTRVPSANLTASVPDLSHRRSMSRLSPVMDKTGRQLFEDYVEDEEEAGDDNDSDAELDISQTIRSAAPGDLQLSVEVSRLQDRIVEFVKQEHLLENLIRQAELTGNQNELKILRRSLVSVRREQRTAIFQKAQFEQQEEENRLVPGRTRVTIPNSTITTEGGESGKEIVRYMILIEQVDEHRTVTLSWVVARRYNEFYELDRALREWAITSGDQVILTDYRKKVVELPGKKLVPVLTANQVEARRLGLLKYLQSLLSSSTMCDSHLVRAFLSRSPANSLTDQDTLSSTASSSLAPHNIVKSLYRTMATSLDDAHLGPSMLDLMYNSLNRQLADVAGGIGGFVGLGLGNEEMSGLIPAAFKNGNGSLPATSVSSTGISENEETAVSSFTAPICDLFVEMFDLKENKNNWLRKQAIVVILQQFLGSTIERKVRDTLRSAASTTSIERLLDTLQETLFPGGERRVSSEIRSEQEKHETRLRASRQLGLLIPDVAANMIGRSNARRAARRVFGALQDRRLNQQLILCILDEVFAVLFPPIKK